VSRPVTGFDYLDAVLNSSVLAMAHRGGAGDPDLLGLENSMAAFGHAASLGYDYLETDVHLTADGDLVAFHDDVWDRVTDATGPVSASTVAQVAQIRIGGTEPVPLLADLLEEFPGARINIDLKADGTAEALADLLSATRAADRVCVGSFTDRGRGLPGDACGACRPNPYRWPGGRAPGSPPARPTADCYRRPGAPRPRGRSPRACLDRE
jgi:glycerophosphoryl diester phosphodiesterase